MTTLLNHVSGRLEIELTEPPVRITDKLANLRAPETARLASVRLGTYVYERDAEGEIADSRSLNDDELLAIAFDGPEIRLGGWRCETTTHAAPNGAFFTLRDLLAAIEEHERQTRGASEWFDGIDVHHVFFEGLHLQENGTWFISWGS